MHQYIENIDKSGNNVPVVQTNSLGEITPVEIYIQDLTIRSRQQRYSDTNQYVLHTSMATYKGGRLGVIDFLNAEDSIYATRSLYIAIPETQTRVNMATELLMLLSDCFCYMVPKSPAVREFIDNFSNRLLDYAVNNYTVTIGPNGEDPLADLHNALQPMWSDSTTTDMVTREFITNPEPTGDSVTTWLIYKNVDGVWVVYTDRDLKLHPQKLITLHNDSDILTVTVHTDKEHVNPWLPQPISTIKGFYIKRYVKPHNATKKDNKEI